jgi:plastocyanin
VATRRTFLAAGGLTLAGLAAPAVLRAVGPVEIQMRATARGEEVWFDPIGVWIPAGQTVRWVLHHDVHTTTAYHPKNDHHSLRIPESATPWDSGFLVQPGAHFDVTFSAEGVYDYYCMPHEQAGMVGRIVVGRPHGPGTRAGHNPRGQVVLKGPRRLRRDDGARACRGGRRGPAGDRGCGCRTSTDVTPKSAVIAVVRHFDRSKGFGKISARRIEFFVIATI